MDDFLGRAAISVYTREQALGDGVLADVSEMAREAGFVWPTAITAAVHALCDPTAEEASTDHQDYAGRLWDVLWMASCAIKLSRSGDSRPEGAGGWRLEYDVLFRFRGRRGERGLRKIRLALVTGPGDDGEPVVTIMLPTED